MPDKNSPRRCPALNRFPRRRDQGERRDVPQPDACVGNPARPDNGRGCSGESCRHGPVHTAFAAGAGGAGPGAHRALARGRGLRPGTAGVERGVKVPAALRLTFASPSRPSVLPAPCRRSRMALSRAQLADPDCPVSDDDYDAIESAIMETTRGRWFLFEYARRHRHADTLMVMSAINSLHDSLQTRLEGNLQANVQSALAAQRRGPYQVSTTVTAALPDQRANLVRAAPPQAAAQPAAGGKTEAKPFEIPGADDRFEFK